MTTAIHTTPETMRNAHINTPKSEYGVGQICFGAVLAVGALYGMWAIVSAMFSYLAG